MSKIEREVILNRDVIDEKKIIIGLITNKKFVQLIRSKIDPYFFDANYLQIISKWCLDFYDKIKDIPFHHIKDIYEKESMGLEKSDIELIDSLLQELSVIHTENQDNEVYLEKIFFRLKEKKELKRMLDEATLYYRSDDIDGAKRALKKRTSIQKETDTGFDLLEEEEIVKTFTKEDDSRIVLFDGLPQKFFRHFKPSWVISFQAPEKTGKSFTLEEFAFAGVEAGYNTTVVSLELGSEELKYRYYQRLCMKGEYEEKGVNMPIMDCKNNQHNSCTFSKRACKIGCFDAVGNKYSPETLRNYKPCTACRGSVEFQPAIWHKKIDIQKMEVQDVLKESKKFKKLFKGRLKGKCFPAFSGTLAEIEDYLDYLEEVENFFTKILIIDYPDILGNDSGEKGRDRVDDIWKRVKQLAQKKDILIFVVEQGNKSTNFKISQDVGDVTEDKRKNAHVNGKYAINVTKEEKRDGVVRIAELFHRHFKTNPFQQLLCLRLLEISHPMIDCELIEVKETETKQFTYQNKS